MKFDYENTSGKPTLIMLVGLAGSGKSTYAKNYGEGYVIHASDDLRKTMFGDVNEHSKDGNAKLFPELHKRIKNDLRNNMNVIYDATNINRKLRMAFLQEIKNIPCHKTCIVIATPYYICLSNNKKRDREVPESAIKRMYMNYQPPHKSEGWDDIKIVYSCDEDDISDFTLDTLYNHATGIDYINQGNKHHSLTLGEHCRKSAKYILEHYPKNRFLHLAALLHDEGKVFTMTAVNSKGERDGNCHYYQHHCVGAYDSIFYLYNLGYHVNDIIHVATLIYFHMCPYREWKMSKSVEKRLKIQLGERVYNEIIALHDADEFAH